MSGTASLIRTGGGRIAEIGELLALARDTAERVGRRLAQDATEGLRAHGVHPEHPREVKALADAVLEQEILADLMPTGISILSEEAGLLTAGNDDTLRFIVDPLDGTFNFVHGLGPWAVSIALWQRTEPVFGVVYSAGDDAVFWGGPGIGSFRGDDPITVSQASDRARASVCTGVPARVDVGDPVYKQRFWDVVSGFGKIRMLGSASISLVHVASGAADAYCEDGIMIWDVAAGLAIVRGAGGSQTCTPGRTEFSVNVFACNGRLTHPANIGSGANEQ
ncbi:MAG: hypothetical protein HOE86_03565 [Gemmatimonadetes bacterium]|nr:hypothetical protein [Gemmatimonadota bacterium]